MLPKDLKSCPKSNKSPNLVTLLMLEIKKDEWKKEKMWPNVSNERERERGVGREREREWERVSINLFYITMSLPKITSLEAIFNEKCLLPSVTSGYVA